MQDKLKILLEQIELYEESKKYFEGGSLERIKCNKEVKSYAFEITLTELVPPFISHLFLLKLQDAFSSIGEVSANFKIENITSNQVVEYYYYLLDQKTKESSSLAILKDYKAEYQNGVLTIVVGNRLEQKKLEELGNEMISDFSHFGIDLSMIVNVNNEINDEISKEIEESKIVEINEEL